MLTLYMKKGCPFCSKVLETLHEEVSAPFCTKYISDEAVAEELVARGGKRMVPYLVDDATGTEMYESDDIATYLRNMYGPGAGVQAS